VIDSIVRLVVICANNLRKNIEQAEIWPVVSYLSRDLSSRTVSPEPRVYTSTIDSRDALLASFTIHETFIMSSIIIIAAVWKLCITFRDLLATFLSKVYNEVQKCRHA